MASSFKIPKKKQPSAGDSAPLHMTSPLSRLQSPGQDFKVRSEQGYVAQSSRAAADRMHAGSRQSASCRPLFSNVVKTLLGLNSPDPAASPANHSTAGRWSGQSQSSESSRSCFSSRWRPQRASDRLLPPSLKRKTVSVEATDSLARLRAQVHSGSSQAQKNSSSEDDLVSPPRTRAGPSVSMPTGSRRRSLEETQRRERETIVLSSEEEEEEEGGGSQREDPPQVSLSQTHLSQSYLQLQFTALHHGLTQATPTGDMMVTEHGIMFPLKGVDEVTVVASQLCGYGVWDGGVVGGGALLAGCSGPAPSLLFLWVSEAQAQLLQRELSIIQQPSTTAPLCRFLLLVLKEQLQELQSALLASILDMKEYRRSCPSSEGPSSPLDWTDGLLLLHSCPPPLDQHLLGLLGHSAESPPQRRSSPRNRKSFSGLPSRLLLYPVAPSRGQITVSRDDLLCLQRGHFLNDVIIDFYLKYLLLEGGGSVCERSHVFSSFFFRHLSARRVAGEDSAASVPDRYTRHQRVKTWTRHVDIFAKDFLFVPVNQECHWFLVVVCFPGLDQVQYQEFQPQSGGSERTTAKPRTGQQDCTLLGCHRDTVVKRPCILVMDSLKLRYHDDVCRLLRDYLQVEWQVRRATPRLFTCDSMRSSTCRVPLQDNSSDCGLYLLQYAESFLQNPVVHFDLPLRLEDWFPRQRVRKKREQIHSLIMRLHQDQTHTHNSLVQ